MHASVNIEALTGTVMSSDRHHLAPHANAEELESEQQPVVQAAIPATEPKVCVDMRIGKYMSKHLCRRVSLNTHEGQGASTKEPAEELVEGEEAQP